MAKVQQKSEKISAFGGIFFVLDKFDRILFDQRGLLFISEFINRVIWLVVSTYSCCIVSNIFSYLQIFASKK